MEKLLAVAGDNQIIRVWDLTTHEQIYKIQKHSEKITSLDFHPDGDWLFSSSEDGTISACFIGK